MTAKDKSSLDNDLVEEIIKLFFNPRSYFHHTFEKLLRSESQKKSVDAPVMEIIERFFKLLARSENATFLYQEVSQLKGFEDFYRKLSGELESLSLPDLSRTDTKKIISRLATETFSLWKQRFSQPDLREYFKTYLRLKENLLNFIDNTSDSDIFLNLKDADNLLKDNNPISVADNNSYIEKAKESQERENESFRNFFQNELNELFESWAHEPYRDASKDERLSFVKHAKDIFDKVLELAKFHDIPKVAKVCEETLSFINRLQLSEETISAKDCEILLSAKDLIINSIADPESNGLHEFLQAIREGRNQEQTDPENSQYQELENPYDSQTAEYNTFYAAPAQEKTEEPNSNSDSENSDHAALSNGEKIHFALPGEDNEELLDLIKDVSLSVNLPVVSEKEDAVRDADEIGPATPIDYESLREVTDREAYQAFTHQAKPMVKIIFESLKLLNEDYVQNKQVIEDIELACASLKHLARKLNLNKLAFLPELVESICINVNAAELKIPTGVLASIARGIKHLISYDSNDELHENMLIDILSDLKRYYAHTVRIIEQTQMASS